MSRALKDAVFDALEHLPATVSHGDRIVWLIVADRSNDRTGYAWPRRDDIANRSGLSVDWVGHAIANLEAHGLLVVQRRPGLRNRYWIVIPNPRGERGGLEDGTPAVSAGGPAVSAGVPRGERGRNQLKNQLENLAPTAPISPAGQCEHRWVTADGDCPICIAEVTA